MRTFISKTNKLSVSTDTGIKSFYPIYLVPDDMADLIGSLNGVEDAGELFDVDMIKTISSEIEANLKSVTLMRDAVASIRDDIRSQMENLAALQDNITFILREISSKQTEIDLSVKESAEISQNAMKIKLNGDEEAARFLEAVNSRKDEIITSVESLSERITDEMKFAVGEINEAKKQTESRLEAAENAVISKLKAYSDECANAAETAKKWAANPEGVPVQNGKYSAYHYAKLLEFNNRGE